ncbi:MAG TPA: stage III sporulation protein AA [Firmicutes bacterium]|nr:stage III sporulation protein AA [Bacillota bacterium]
MSNYLRFQREILPILAPSLRKLIASLPQNLVGALEELRLRALRPLGVVCNRGDGFLQASGRIVSEPERGYMVTREELATTVELISQHSLYAYVEEMRHGYITIPGGHRVGLCGRTVVEERRVVLLRDIQSLNIRISRQVLGAADSVMEHILGPCGRICSTLILSPPGCGKTTLLRDIARQLSRGIPRLGFPGVQVAVVDERSEIGGCYQGVPQNDLGPRTDVLDGCPKAQGIMMLLRSMGPRVIVTDEIGSLEDARAIQEALLGGVSIITTAHGSDLEEVVRRFDLSAEFLTKSFQKVIVLSRRQGPGTIQKVLELGK